MYKFKVGDFVKGNSQVAPFGVAAFNGYGIVMKTLEWWFPSKKSKCLCSLARWKYRYLGSCTKINKSCGGKNK